MKKKKPSRRRAITPRRTQSFEALTRAAVTKATLIPDVTELLGDAEEAAMIDAYIDQHCRPDARQGLRAAAKADRGRDDTSADIMWIKEEIAFALGMEVGRRLAGGLSFDYLTRKPYRWQCDEPSRTGGRS